MSCASRKLGRRGVHPLWLASTPQLPDAAQAATRATAGERPDKVLYALGRRLAKEPRLHLEICDDILGRGMKSHTSRMIQEPDQFS